MKGWQRIWKFLCFGGSIPSFLANQGYNKSYRMRELEMQTRV